MSSQQRSFASADLEGSRQATSIPTTLDCAGDLATALDLYLAIGDHARYMTGSPDQEPLADDQFPLKFSADLPSFNRGVPFEVACFRDFHLTTIVQRRL